MSVKVNSENVIILNDVWVQYNGVPVIKGISMSIEKNDFLGIIGRMVVGKQHF